MLNLCIIENMNGLAPIVLFVYNRPEHTRQTLQALSDNFLADESTLYVYSDGPKEGATEIQLNKIAEVRNVIREKQWCREVRIIEAEKNKGLASSVIDGVTAIVNEYGRTIVLEDDLISAKGFLKYMNESLQKYESEDSVMQVSGYCLPVKDIKSDHSSFFIPVTTSWGWGTWRRAWEHLDERAKGYEELKINAVLRRKFNLDDIYDYSGMLIAQIEGGNVDSWAIRWWWSVFRGEGLVLHPDKSLIKNFGWDGSGIHCGEKDYFYDANWKWDYYIEKWPGAVKVNEKYFRRIKKYINQTVNINLGSKKQNIFHRVINKIKK